MDFLHRRNRKTKDYFFFFIHFPLPLFIKLPSHLVRWIQFQIKPQFHQDSSFFTFYRFIPVTFSTVLPSVLFLLQTFSFTRLLVASSQQGTKSSKVLAVERFVIRSRVSAILHPPSFFLFSIFMHTSLRAVCFLSVSSSHYFFFTNVGTTIICFATIFVILL